MIVTHKTPKVELKKASLEFADSIADLAPESQKDAFARAIYDTGACLLIKELARLFSYSLEEITHDRKTLFMILNARYLLDSLSIIVRKLGMINDRVLLDSPYTAKVPQDKYPYLICADISALYMWLMLRGAPAHISRRVVDSKSQMYMLKTEKGYGPYAFPTLAVRAEIAVNNFSKHVLLPACVPHLEGKDNTKLNSLAGAFEGIKR